MPSIISVASKLTRDFPALRFVPGKNFHWSPETATVYYIDSADAALLLHEVGHAALNHAEYTYDIDLIKMERDAWEFASTFLSDKYGVVISQELQEDMLDTYREWLHRRSTCTDCHAAGLQTGANLYTCLACKTSWRVNEARSCALKRYPVHIK